MNIERVSNHSKKANDYDYGLSNMQLPRGPQRERVNL